jgi:hypothetical protein
MDPIKLVGNMKKLYLPYIILPSEFVTLLKSNLSAESHYQLIHEIISKNEGLYCLIEKSFKEFDEGRGFERTLKALGWTSFRERMASLYIFKCINGIYPEETNMALVEDLKDLEAQYSSYSVHGSSRLFLLGLFLKFANLNLKKKENFQEMIIPDEIGVYLRLSQVKSLKIDWVILILLHLLQSLGDKMLLSSLAAGKNIDDLYILLNPEARKEMLKNLLAYGASINEPDMFLYEKI